MSTGAPLYVVGGAAPRSDRDTPNIVLAPAPSDRTSPVRLYANPATIRRLIDDRLNAKIGEYCGLVHGNVDENTPGGIVPGGTPGLMSAQALFRGIRRPRQDLGRDETIYVYITNPSWSYSYPSKDRFAVVGPTKTAPPKNSVFATYVELFDEVCTRQQHNAPADVDGIVHFWEWLRASDSDPKLPEFFAARYAKRVW